MATSESKLGSENVNQTYAKVASYDNDETLGQTKPVFLLESDIFGSGKPNKDIFLFHKEVYKAVGEHIETSHLKGLQRVRGMWRIYPDEEEDRNKLLINGLVIRKKKVNLYARNPYVTKNENPNYIRIRVKDIPCSADDGQISRFLERSGCCIRNMQRERLRIDGLLTNCLTGDRIYMCDPFSKPIPRYVEIGKYKAAIFYRNQPKQSYADKTCIKCLETGHIFFQCPNDWKCKQCHQIGHKQSECAEPFTENDDSGNTDAHAYQSEQNDNESCHDDETNTEQSDCSTEQESDADENNAAETEKTKESNDKPIPMNELTQTDQSQSTVGKAPDVAQNEEKNKQKKTKKRDKKTKVENKQETLEKYISLENKSSNLDTPNNKTGKRSATTPTSELHGKSIQPQKAKT